MIITNNPNKYISFPDLIYFKDQYICVFREADAHHPKESWLTILKSNDGKIWKRRNFAAASLEHQGFVFNCPRLSVVDGVVWLVCDTKTSQQERNSEWDIIGWHSDDGKSWNVVMDFKIEGMVPDRIIKHKNKYLMGYHIIENNSLVQMVATSNDCKHWRDRSTIATSNKNQYCEGSIVDIAGSLICFLRDNKNPLAQARYSISHDGHTWTEPIKLGLPAQRIVAGVKKKEPYKNHIIATYRDTLNKTVSLFIMDLAAEKLITIEVDKEHRENNLYDFGYTGWVENNDGSISIVYYIQKDNKKPVICYTELKLQEF